MEEERRRPSQSVLFICKKRFTSGGMTYTGGLSSGLFNSANFVVDMLLENGIHSASTVPAALSRFFCLFLSMLRNTTQHMLQISIIFHSLSTGGATVVNPHHMGISEINPQCTACQNICTETGTRG